MIVSKILTAILKDYALYPFGYHGLRHWARVLENGLKLAESTGANPTVVTLFALYHDSRRETDCEDWGHGLRGAELARSHFGRYFDLPTKDMWRLYKACEFHTDCTHDDDITVATCWDADRLDLARVRLEPDPRYLNSAAAKSPELIAWACERARSDFEPAFVRTDWLLTLPELETHR